MIEEKQILHDTHYGLDIYAHILRKYYPDEIVIELSGKTCKPTRNPFNEDKMTLNIRNQDWVFQFEDVELPDFKGNPFDFAAFHFQLSGQELLQKINEEMNLLIGEPKGFYTNKKSKIQVPEIEIDLPRFSYFRSPVTNTIPNADMTIPDVYGAIKSNKYKCQTEKLRSILSPLPCGEGSGERLEAARKYKAKHFDYVTFSGMFSKRNDSALIQHSGMITLDFDHVSNLQELQEALLLDRYFETELMFVSPSGDGLKWIISIDLKECNHQDWFQAISAYIKQLINWRLINPEKTFPGLVFSLTTQKCTSIPIIYNVLFHKQQIQKIMQPIKYNSFLLKMLFKPASSNWPLWWTVLPFLSFYADILLKFSLLCMIIF